MGDTSSEDGRLHAYLRTIERIPIPTAEDEAKLVRRLTEGDVPARAQIINANLWLVVRVARQYARDAASLIELILEGNIGLVKAADGFRPECCTRFRNYAVGWIRDQICSVLPVCGLTVRIPGYMGRLVLRWKNMRQELKAGLHREPTEGEIHESRKGLTLNGSVALPEESDREGIQRCLDTLTELEAEVLCLRHGLDGDPSLSWSQVGERLHLTRDEIRSIELTALYKLAPALEEDTVDPTMARLAARRRMAGEVAFPQVSDKGEANVMNALTGEQIRRIRKTLGLTQSELARRLGLGRSGQTTVSMWERGHGIVLGNQLASLRKLAAGINKPDEVPTAPEAAQTVAEELKRRRGGRRAFNLPELQPQVVNGPDSDEGETMGYSSGVLEGDPHVEQLKRTLEGVDEEPQTRPRQAVSNGNEEMQIDRKALEALADTYRTRPGVEIESSFGELKLEITAHRGPFVVVISWLASSNVLLVKGRVRYVQEAAIPLLRLYSKDEYLGSLCIEEHGAEPFYVIKTAIDQSRYSLTETVSFIDRIVRESREALSAIQRHIKSSR